MPDVSKEEKLMEFLEQYGKLTLTEADDVDIYSLSNSEGTIVWHFDAEGKSTLENLERMKLQLKNILLGHCEKIEENHK